MLKINLQFFGGRGGGGGKGSGGGASGGGSNAKGSASNPASASELDSMNEKQRISAFNAMPVGTKVRSYNQGVTNDSGSTYVKTESGWGKEYTYKAVKGGKLVNKKSTTSVTLHQMAVSTGKFANGSEMGAKYKKFLGVKYPKK